MHLGGRPGAIVAIVGSHGAGKTTVAEGLQRWLSGRVPTMRVHFGKPPRSLVTRGIRAWVRVGRVLARPSAEAATRSHPPEAGRLAVTLWILWQWSRARDRYRAYVRARRFAAGGGVVICDRYPLDAVRSMDHPIGSLAPRGVGAFAGALIKAEQRYHRRIPEPDLLVVLRIDPETSLRRRLHGEPASVRDQAIEVYDAAWPDTAYVVDAAKGEEAVLEDVRTFVRSALDARLGGSAPRDNRPA
jgi:thymidylate kinase